MERVVEQARADGFVTTIFGRRRYLNDIASRNAVARGLAERNAVNAPIQGSAADIMKIAMIEVSRRFAAEGIRSKVILQVHDELVVDMLREERERVTAIVTESMESAAQLRVRLLADAGIGENWLEAHCRRPADAPTHCGIGCRQRKTNRVARFVRATLSVGRICVRIRTIRPDGCRNC